ncbi:MAG: 4Fe-4S binding protein [Alphaproteobacteria bacterium]|nr:4Fe-4S binding protein [Alphaproteobacteria bacterium]
MEFLKSAGHPNRGLIQPVDRHQCSAFGPRIACFPTLLGDRPRGRCRVQAGQCRKRSATQVRRHGATPWWAAPAALLAAPTEAAAVESALAREIAIWEPVWRGQIVDITILVLALGVLTLIFFCQDWLARRPHWTARIRMGFLAFTVAWLGFYAGAQLSVAHVLSFIDAILTDFRWELFLAEPLIFVLWLSVAASLLFWGRGAFCGWLCPFGALQELLNKVAKLARVPQLALPWGLHERLWPVKYVVFLGLFGLSLGSLDLALQYVYVEPFAAVFPLAFDRAWPAVAYAGVLLFAGLFIERFFCRYLCPLGAALAIPGRIRMFEWLRRYKECGSSCDLCARECMVGAIHPDGSINPNECLYCLHCQQVYYDDHKCPVRIEKRLRIERRLARQSKSASSRAGAEVASSVDQDQ